ncbi:hypothetical protein M426DRAFT_318741 [Hypoxylon sp. CI-4A]|nr:hypothetical protein M426DRAFT_318741 [Hypoxylon sp. CI-4A]
MASARIPALRNLLGRRQPFRLPNQQRRWAQVHDVRFLATTQASHKVTEKYREKLDRKAREEGLNGIGELKEAYKDRIQELAKKDSVSIPGLGTLLSDEPAPTAQSQSQSQPQSQTSPDGITQTPPPSPQPQPQAQPAAPGPGKATAPIKSLSDILDLPKARQLPEKELSAIWRLRHAASANSLCAVIPQATYASMESTARAHPSFVLPVPRGEEGVDAGAGAGAGAGAEMHFLQWVFDAPSRTATVLFTQLAEFKVRGEWALPHTSVTHYWDQDLGRRPGVVLMAGTVVDGRGATVTDAQWLVMLLQRFYGPEGAENGGAKRALLEAFRRGGEGFSVERLLEESEKLG